MRFLAAVMGGVAALSFVGAAMPSTVVKPVAVAGSYAGSSGQGWGITFFVAPGGRALLNVSVPTISYSCTQASSASAALGILKVAVKPSGTFSAKSSQSGVLNGLDAKFTYAIAGRLQPATASSPPTAAGTWREDIKYSSGATCTSNAQSWSAKRDSEPLQKKVLVMPGSYSGLSGQGWGITFSVASGGKSISSVSVPTIAYSCKPSGSVSAALGILKVPIKPGGSFTSTTSQTGVVNGVSAKFTYTFAGYFEGPTPAGAQTVAGKWREDIVFPSGTTQSCTSNDQFWRATRS